jgi:hypothetical protein
MSRFLCIIAVIVVAVGGLGYYLGWFNFGSDRTHGTDNFTLTVHENKIKEDEEKAKEKLHNLGDRAKDAVAPGTEKKKD